MCKSFIILNAMQFITIDRLRECQIRELVAKINDVYRCIAPLPLINEMHWGPLTPLHEHVCNAVYIQPVEHAPVETAADQLSAIYIKCILNIDLTSHLNVNRA